MTEDKFSYQNLRVYEDMIRCFSFAEAVISGWEPIHAIVDHFNRASEGALVCLAEACRTRHIDARVEVVGYSMGSILECASCFDIAVCKSLLNQEKCDEIKQQLGAIFGQLHSLMESWKETEVRETSPPYGKVMVFNHERLQVYKVALQVISHIAACQLLNRATRPDFRRIDEAATSIVLNIAEGNGRFSHLDHSRFLEIANRSNTKLAARIEMCALRGTIEKEESIKLNKLLVRIDQMTARLADTWRNHER